MLAQAGAKAEQEDNRPSFWDRYGFEGPAPEPEPIHEPYGADLAAMSEEDAAAAREDRAAAAEELADDFDIVPDGMHGPLLPNQLRQEEFDNLAVLYSDIRTSNGNLSFDASGSGMSEEDFQAAVMTDIDTLIGTSQGRGLLKDITYQEVDGEARNTTIGWSSTPLGAHMDVADGSTWGDASNGTGAHTRFEYQPGETLVVPGHEEWVDTNTSDIILFHELVHSDNAGAGTLGRTLLDDEHLVTPTDGGKATDEEYATVGLGGFGGEFTENGYRGERNLIEEYEIPRRDTYRPS